MKSITLIVVLLALTSSPFTGTNIFDIAEDAMGYCLSIWTRLSIATSLILVVVYFTYQKPNPYTEPVGKIHSEMISTLETICSDDGGGTDHSIKPSKKIKQSLRKVRESYKSNLENLTGTKP